MCVLIIVVLTTNTKQNQKKNTEPGIEFLKRMDKKKQPNE